MTDTVVMFVRVKTTPNSPRRSVQVVQSSRIGAKVTQRIVRYMGIALDDDEEAKLKLMAQEYIERSELEALNTNALFATESIDGLKRSSAHSSAHGAADGTARKPGRPKRQTLDSVVAPEEVRLGDVQEVARHVEGPHEVLGHLYDYLGFGRVLDGRGNAILRDLVIARVMAPGSKRETVAQLELHYGRSYDLDQVYRLLDRVHERLDALKHTVLQATKSLVGGVVQMMLFDVTTLYFESVQADRLRAFGYSKDQKYHVTQVVLALATDADGLPIGYELFAGNTAEVKTLLACMARWRESLQIDKVSFVADRALCSRANLSTLEAGSWPYVVAMPLQRSLKEAERAMVLNTALAAPCQIDGELLWTREFEWEGRRLIVSYSAKRAHKDQEDRQAIIARLQAKLDQANKGNANKGNAHKLISNKGYLRYIAPADAKGSGVFVLDEGRVAADAAWDGLHAIVTNDRDSSAAELLTRYRRLWVIEESFRTIKHSLAVRPIYHFKPERIEAHIGLCYLAFALTRHAQQRIKLAQEPMSVERIRAALHGVQASILEHKKTHAKYRLPSAFSHDAAKIYRAFGLTRDLNVGIQIP